MIKMKLQDLFNNEELNKLSNLINKKDFIEIRIFLNEENVSNKLNKKGILPDYLYYFLEYNFNKIKIE